MCRWFFPVFSIEGQVEGRVEMLSDLPSALRLDAWATGQSASNHIRDLIPRRFGPIARPRCAQLSMQRDRRNYDPSIAA